MTCVIKFNITTTYIVIFQNKYKHIILLFTYCMTDIVPLMYFKISSIIGEKDLNITILPTY